MVRVEPAIKQKSGSEGHSSRTMTKALPIAQAFLNGAKAYRSALEVTRTSAEAPSMDAPSMFLGCHSIELGLKAFLRGRGLRVPRSHDLSKLLNACVHAGMSVSREAKQCIDVAVDEIEVHGYRYFVFADLGSPTVEYLAETADEILATVTKESANWPADGLKKAVMKFRVGRAVPKNHLART